MLLLDFQSSSSSRPASCREQDIDVSLTAGGHLAFNTPAGDVGILVRRGRIWLTDGPVDHVLSGFHVHTCAGRTRVVITALSEASLTVRVRPLRSR